MSKRKGEEVVAGDAASEKKVKTWHFPLTHAGTNTVNPIREIVDLLKIPKGTEAKPLIPLSIGDPTKFGNLVPPTEVSDAVCRAIKSGKYNGYGPSVGYPDARAAVAKRFGTDAAPLTGDDVVLASGCSGAIVLALAALANAGDNVLIPRPGFSLYETASRHYDIKLKSYKLLPDRDWEVDLKDLEAQVDSRTRAVIINNPSNPAGSNFSRAHIAEIVALSKRLQLPIIADEIYHSMVFGDAVFTPLADVAVPAGVPVIALGGLSKMFLVPGWRMGWAMLHDPAEHLKDIRGRMFRLSTLILGPHGPTQAALPDILATPASYLDRVRGQLSEQADAIVNGLKGCPGLTCIVPKGAMYLMVRVDVDRFPGIKDDKDFAQQLLDEELVFVLPGACFRQPNFIRIVFLPPVPMLKAAAERMQVFCKNRYKA